MRREARTRVAVHVTDAAGQDIGLLRCSLYSKLGVTVQRPSPAASPSSLMARRDALRMGGDKLQATGKGRRSTHLYRNSSFTC